MPCPSEKLRELADEQVSTRSPRPLRPASVSRFAPCARPKRVISAKPRPISAARAFWPSPLPSTTPQAIASTFLTAPPISAPARSSEKIDAEGRLTDPLAQLLGQIAILVPPGSPRWAVPWRPRGRRSDPTELRSGAPGQHCLATWWSNWPLASSIPLEQRISGLSQPRARSSTARMCCAGVTTSQASHASRSPRSAVARIAAFSGTPARNREFSRLN